MTVARDNATEGSLSKRRYGWLSAALTEGAEIITASRRLARDLTIAYGEHQQAAGKAAWLTPSIYFWQDWLSLKLASANDPAALPRRLDPLSSAIIWERCLRRRMPDGLLNFPGIVRQAALAWQRLNDWNLPVASALSAAGNQDERLFARAAADYRDMLDDGDWLDLAGMPAMVATLIRQRGCEVPSVVRLAGFDRLHPAVAAVVGALESVDCQVIVGDETTRATSVAVASFERLEAELRTAGAWARVLLQQNPGARVAIVCPALETRAQDIGRLVREGLVPGWQFADGGHRLAVNVSYGQRLAEYPAIATVLLLMRWVQRGLAGRELSVLLRSQCIAGAGLAGRSRLELELRQHPDREWQAENFLAAFAGSEPAADARAFFEVAQKVAALHVSVNEKITPLACVAALDDLITAARWPGVQSLDSAEFQLVNRWRELLNEFARAELVLPVLSLSDAVRRITSLAAETIWQPETGQGIVQVLGTLEAAGLEFDALWISGLDTTQWPPPSKPSQLISNALQREHGMPDATPADTLAFTRRLLRRLVNAAGQCVLSWSQIREDGEVTASSLLDDIDARPYVGTGDPGWFARHIAASQAVAIESDDDVVPVGPREQVAGGAYTLQRQYEEPFSAFVYGRLGVRNIEAFRIGLAPSVRGIIIHNALHTLLAQRPSREELRAWSATEREQRIGSAADTALAAHTRHADAVTRRIIALERQRLRAVLHQFLETECRRDPFTVDNVECELNYERFGLRLGFRIDRIDRLADGRLLVIDYKTGAQKTFLRQTGELRDVQLVAYADALDAEVGGLVFINVDSREVGYRGVGGGWNAADEEGWSAKLDSWRSDVQTLVKSLAAGDVRVNLRQSAAEGRALGILSRLEELKRVR